MTTSDCRSKRRDALRRHLGEDTPATVKDVSLAPSEDNTAASNLSCSAKNTEKDRKMSGHGLDQEAVAPAANSKSTTEKKKGPSNEKTTPIADRRAVNAGRRDSGSDRPAGVRGTPAAVVSVNVLTVVEQKATYLEQISDNLRFWLTCKKRESDESRAERHVRFRISRRRRPPHKDHWPLTVGMIARAEKVAEDVKAIVKAAVEQDKKSAYATPTKVVAKDSRRNQAFSKSAASVTLPHFGAIPLERQRSGDSKKSRDRTWESANSSEVYKKPHAFAVRKFNQGPVLPGPSVPVRLAKKKRSNPGPVLPGPSVPVRLAKKKRSNPGPVLPGPSVPVRLAKKKRASKKSGVVSPYVTRSRKAQVGRITRSSPPSVARQLFQ